MERARPFPLPPCEGCGSRPDCAARGTTRPELPACRTPLRNIDLTRTAALLAHLRLADGLRTPPPVAALEAALLAQFDQDRHAFSDVLELSFSCDRAGTHLYRYSYAFPGFERDPAGVSTSLLGLCEPFGEPVLDACRAVLRAARSRAVEQPLFGFAHDGAGEYRVKLYLQMRASEAPAASALAGRMLGIDVPERLGPLHLLGLDLGERGLSGAKLYFVQPHLPLDTAEARVGPVPLLAALAAIGVPALRDVLAIHRVAGPGGTVDARPSEVDFSLPDNDLLWSEVRPLPPVRALVEKSPAIDVLGERFDLCMRRISGSVGDGDKLNVYYVLREQEREPASP